MAKHYSWVPGFLSAFTLFFPFVFISEYNLADLANPDWPNLKNKNFGCCCKSHIIINRYLNKEYRLCYFDCAASGYSNCIQLKYVILCYAQHTFSVRRLHFVKWESLSVKGKGSQSFQLAIVHHSSSVCVSWSPHWQPDYMSKIPQSFSSASKSYFLLPLSSDTCSLNPVKMEANSLQPEAVETCSFFLVVHK